MPRAEIGVEWVLDYHERAPNTHHCRIHAEGFYNKLDGVKVFHWGNDLAWDQDFEESGAGKPSAGTDTFWADDVDIVYFAGHGNDEVWEEGKTKAEAGGGKETSMNTSRK